MTSPIAIGIDLGTTFCCVAILRDPEKGPEIIPSIMGKNTTASFVAYEDEEEVYAGDIAKDLAYNNPENTVFDIKRLIGRSFHDSHVRRYNQLWPFNLVNKHGMVAVTVWGRILLPQVIATTLISHLKKTAEDFLGVPVDSAVITVPVYFTDLHEGLTREACEKAGLTDVSFIPEPVAAAYAYGLQSSTASHETRVCLIFDLGGGTYDLTIFTLQGKHVEILGTGGDDRLGGEDFNDVLSEYCLNEFKKIHNVDLTEGKASPDLDIRKATAKKLRRIRKECEKQKCFLSSAPSVVVSLDGLYEDKEFAVPVTRKLFESLIDGHLVKSMKIMDKVLKEAGLAKDQVDDVVLVGGSSRIPKVQELLVDYFGENRVHRTINADEAVACGAAIKAHSNLHGSDSGFTSVTSIEKSIIEAIVKKTSEDKLSIAVELPKLVQWHSSIDGFPRIWDHGGVTVGERIFSFGGESMDEAYTKVGNPITVFALQTGRSSPVWKFIPLNGKSASPSQRWEHTVVAHGSHIYMWGGWNGKDYCNKLYRFDSKALTWDTPNVSGKPPQGRRDHSAVVIRSHMYVFGGYEKETEYSQKLYCLNLHTLSWSLVTPKGVPPSRRCYHSATVYRDRFMFIFGGKECSGSDGGTAVSSNSLMCYDVERNEWIEPKTTGAAPQRRWSHSAFMRNGFMYIFGGFNDGIKTQLNDTYCYNPEKNEWAEVNPKGVHPSPRSGSRSAVLDDKVYIFGGVGARYFDDTIVLQIK